MSKKMTDQQDAAAPQPPLSREREIEQRAAELFYRRGYDAASLRELGKLVGMEVPSLYNHMDSKQELLTRILCRALDDLADTLRTHLADVFDPVDRMRVAVRTYVLFHEERLADASISDTELRSLTGESRSAVLKRRATLADLFAGIVRDGARSGAFTVPDEGIAVLAVLSVCARLPMWYRPGGRLNLDQVADLLADFAVSALTAPRTAALNGTRKKRS